MPQVAAAVRAIPIRMTTPGNTHFFWSSSQRLFAKAKAMPLRRIVASPKTICDSIDMWHLQLLCPLYSAMPKSFGQQGSDAVGFSNAVGAHTGAGREGGCGGSRPDQRLGRRANARGHDRLWKGGFCL